MFCEEHRRFYVTEESEFYDDNAHHYPSCCDALFHSKPFFSPVGTCYTTKALVIETSPATYSNIRIWTTLHKDDSPGKKA